MKYLLIICTLCWNLTGTAVAAPEMSEVMELLEGRHWKLDAVAFQSLGDDTDSVLIEIAGDTAAINYLRFRALEALSLFPSEKLPETLHRSTICVLERWKLCRFFLQNIPQSFWSKPQTNHLQHWHGADLKL